MSTFNQQPQSENTKLVGVLLVNTGTPAAPTPQAVRKFLTQFLSDPYVIGFPRWLWLPLLHGVILRIRPRRSVQLYQRIWTQAGSPLLLGTQNLAAKLQIALSNNTNIPLRVLAGMRYGEPSIPKVLRQFREHGVGKIIVLPLFPQYSETTTGTVLAAVERALQTWSSTPDLEIIRDYYDHPAYIRVLAEHIQANMGDREYLLFSFHGIPKSYTEAGDPYEAQCQKTGTMLAKELNLDAENGSLAFQSRFGPQEWLKPYTDEELARLGEKSLSKLNIVCPGFAIDCLETLEEIAEQGAKTFQDSGGGMFNYIPALNDSAAHVEALSEIILPYFG